MNGDVLVGPERLTRSADRNAGARIDLKVSLGRSKQLEHVRNCYFRLCSLAKDRSPIIRLTAVRSGDTWILGVKDNGIGIEPHYHDKVFGLFDRLNPSVDGSGVGLALVKRIIEVHNGKVWIESEGSGQGTQVYFTLPAASGEMQ